MIPYLDKADFETSDMEQTFIEIYFETSEIEIESRNQFPPESGTEEKPAGKQVCDTTCQNGICDWSNIFSVQTWRIIGPEGQQMGSLAYPDDGLYLRITLMRRPLLLESSRVCL